jgi:hypothetical protein
MQWIATCANGWGRGTSTAVYALLHPVHMAPRLVVFKPIFAAYVSDQSVRDRERCQLLAVT